MSGLNGYTGVTFDNIDVYSKWGFFIVTKTVGTPRPKVYKVDIPGGNGSIDITESIMGTTAYENREIEIRLRAIGEQNLWTSKHTQMLRDLHGRKMKIIFDDDAGYYYIGRLDVGEIKYNFDVAEVTITADCDPFKYLINAYGSDWLWDPFDFVNGYVYDDTKTITNTTQVQIETMKMPVTPSFRASKAMTVTYQGATYTIPADTDITFYELVLTEGTHTLTFKCSGTGTVKITFTNGIL